MKKTASFSFYFLFFAANAALLPFIALYYQELRFTGAQIGLLFGISPLIGLVGAPFWTGLADATRRHRLIMTIAMAMSIVCGILFPILTTFIPILLLILVYSIFSSPVASFADSAALAILEGKKELYGRLRMGGTIGWGLAAPFIGMLVEAKGLRLAFWSFSTLMFLALIVSQNFPYKKAEAGTVLKSGMGVLLKNRRYVLFLILAVVCGIGLSSVNTYLFSYMAELNASRTTMGLALSLTTLVELPVMFFSNRLLRVFKVRGLYRFGFLLTALRLLLYAAVSTPAGVLVFQLLNGLTFSTVWVAGVSYADQTAPPGMNATAQGLFSAMIFGIGSAIGGLSGSLLLSALGGRGMYLVIGLFMLLSFGVITLLEKRIPDLARNNLTR